MTSSERTKTTFPRSRRRQRRSSLGRRATCEGTAAASLRARRSLRDPSNLDTVATDTTQHEDQPESGVGQGLLKGLFVDAVRRVAPKARPLRRPSPGNCSAVATMGSKPRA